MGCIMSPCLLAEALIALFFGPAGSPPSAPRGSPRAIEIKNLELPVLKPFLLIALSP